MSCRDILGIQPGVLSVKQPTDAATGDAAGTANPPDAGLEAGIPAPDAGLDAGWRPPNPDITRLDAGHDGGHDGGLDAGSGPMITNVDPCDGQEDCTVCKEATDCPKRGDCEMASCEARRCSYRNRTQGDACGQGQRCLATGQCVDCLPGERRCLAGSAIKRQSCDEQGRWQSAADCVNQACAGGDCRGECEPATSGCVSPRSFRQCQNDGTWSEAMRCASGTCQNGSCIGVCSAGTTRCSDQFRYQTCSSLGQWGSAVSCNYVCVDGECGGECKPGVVECTSDTTLHSCGDSGRWTAPASCAFGCREGRCNACRPNTTECTNEAEVRTCSSTGVWDPTTEVCTADLCRRPTCGHGECGQAIATGADCLGSGTCAATGMCEYCGDGAINREEECEAFEAGWEPETCAEGCARSTYQICQENGAQTVDCYCGPSGVCSELCGEVQDCPPPPPNATAVCYHGLFCALSCATHADCPRGLACRDDPSQVGADRAGLCMPPETTCPCDQILGCDDCFQIIITD